MYFQKPEGQFHDIYWAAHDLESVKKVNISFDFVFSIQLKNTILNST